MLIPRDRRREVIERIDAHGRVETPLDPASLAIVVAPPPVITATLPPKPHGPRSIVGRFPDAG